MTLVPTLRVGTQERTLRVQQHRVASECLRFLMGRPMLFGITYVEWVILGAVVCVALLAIYVAGAEQRQIMSRRRRKICRQLLQSGEKVATDGRCTIHIVNEEELEPWLHIWASSTSTEAREGACMFYGVTIVWSAYLFREAGSESRLWFVFVEKEA